MDIKAFNCEMSEGNIAEILKDMKEPCPSAKYRLCDKNWETIVWNTMRLQADYINYDWLRNGTGAGITYRTVDITFLQLSIEALLTNCRALNRNAGKIILRFFLLVKEDGLCICSAI
ncbi:MAG: hypothetical protein ACLVG5_03035 [Clostridium sp.]